MVGSPLLTFEVLFCILSQFQTFSSIFNALIFFVAIFLFILGKSRQFIRIFPKKGFHKACVPYTGAGSGITRALKFTPGIKFINDETLNEFVVTVERRDVGEIDVKNDRDSDREDRDKRDEEDRDNSLSAKYIENNEATKRDNDGVEEAKDRTNIVRILYKQLSNVQKDIIQFCSIPRTAKEIMDHIGYYNNSKNMTTYVRPLLEMGYLEMTEPDKPKSKNQKYRKVRKE